MPQPILTAYAAADADGETAYLKALKAGKTKEEAIAEMQQAFRRAWRELVGC